MVLLRRIAPVALLAVAGFVTPATADVLRFSHTDNPGGSRQAAAELFAQKVEEYTDGRHTVRIYPAGQLANDPKAVEQLQLGGLDFTVTATGTYATHLPTLNITTMPYLVDTYEQGWEFYDNSEWLQGEFAKLPEKGMRILATWEAGFRSFTTKGELASPAEAEGHKIRVYPNDMIRWTMEALGFQTVILPIPEVYLGIQQGTVWGQENPVDTIYSLRFYEVAPHITLTRHIYSPLPLAIAESTWQELSEEDRDAIQRAAEEAAQFSRETVRAAVDRQLEEMASKGATVATPDVEPFREAAEEVYAKAREAYGEDVDKVLADVQAIRDAMPSN
ncbi:TRAP transporter substrate-binding protein [Acuticoccus sp.]|uniref:TRAP transporter substrate-binding protein n=1 Tax=Acuticoccus sp. TaxID=1904378 RepID=UPI003B527839